MFKKLFLIFIFLILILNFNFINAQTTKYFKTLSPKGNEHFFPTDTIHISWDVEGFTGTEGKIRIFFYTGGRSDGKYDGWYPIAGNLPLQDGSYDLNLSTLNQDLEGTPIEFWDPLRFRIRVGIYVPSSPGSWKGGWLTWTTPYGKTGQYYDETGHFWVILTLP